MRTGLNTAGTVAGHSASCSDNVSSFHAYIWTAGTGIMDLTPGASASYACGINTAGDVVGFAGQDAYVSTGGTTYDLNALAIDGKSAWTLLERAISINDTGDIFGIGIIGGAETGFLLTNTTINLIVDGGFESDNPPNLAQPGGFRTSPIGKCRRNPKPISRTAGLKMAPVGPTANLDCGITRKSRRRGQCGTRLCFIRSRGSLGRLGRCERERTHGGRLSGDGDRLWAVLEICDAIQCAGG